MRRGFGIQCLRALDAAAGLRDTGDVNSVGRTATWASGRRSSDDVGVMLLG
jgi:hypothetical protein